MDNTGVKVTVYDTPIQGRMKSTGGTRTNEANRRNHDVKYSIKRNLSMMMNNHYLYCADYNVFINAV